MRSEKNCIISHQFLADIRFDLAQARDIYDELVCQKYVKKGELTAKYYEDKRNGTLDFEELNNMKDGIIAALDTVFNPSSVKPEDARKPKTANFQQENFDKKSSRSYGNVLTNAHTIK